MASVRKRSWKTATGQVKTCWLVDFIDQNGKRKAKQFKTKKEADAFETDMRADVRDRRYVHAHDNPTVEQVKDDWFAFLNSRRAAGEMEAACVEDYKGKFRLHILSSVYGIGREKIGLLTWARIEEFRRDMLAHEAPGRPGKKNSAANAAKVLAVLKQALKWGVDHGVVANHPMDGRRQPANKRQAGPGAAVSVPSHDAVTRIIAAADAADARAKAMMAKGGTRGRPPKKLFIDMGLAARCAALLGLRASEQWGLDWRAVDLAAGVVRVEQRLDRRTLDIGAPKSEAGYRDVPVPPDLLRRLKERHLAQGRPAEGLVFTGPEGGPISHDNFTARHWRPLLVKAKAQGTRWHDLRHYALSAWFEAGCSLKVAQARIGHADPNVTLRVYAHVISRDTGEDVAAIEQRLG